MAQTDDLEGKFASSQADALQLRSALARIEEAHAAGTTPALAEAEAARRDAELQVSLSFAPPHLRAPL